MACKTNLLRRQSTLPSPTHSSLSRIKMLALNVGATMDKRLQRELDHQKDKDKTPDMRIQRIRAKGRSILHSNYLLVVVVFLNVIDCGLVVGGLIMELHVIKSMNQKLNVTLESFRCITNETKLIVPASASRSYLLVKISHGFHYASIAILSLLLLEIILKIACFGCNFVKHKFEVFDAFVVSVSFVIDLVFLKGTIEGTDIYKAEVLSFMVPWRIIRVVNSLVVALLLNEHIKLMIMFRSKQLVQRQLDDLSDDFDIIRQQLIGIKELAIADGVPDWKINKITAEVFSRAKQRRNAVKTMVAMAMSAAGIQSNHMRQRFGRKSISHSIKRGVNSVRRRRTLIPSRSHPQNLESLRNQGDVKDTNTEVTPKRRVSLLPYLFSNYYSRQINNKEGGSPLQQPQTASDDASKNIFNVLGLGVAKEAKQRKISLDDRLLYKPTQKQELNPTPRRVSAEDVSVKNPSLEKQNGTAGLHVSNSHPQFSNEKSREEFILKILQPQNYLAKHILENETQVVRPNCSGSCKRAMESTDNTLGVITEESSPDVAEDGICPCTTTTITSSRILSSALKSTYAANLGKGIVNFAYISDNNNRHEVNNDVTPSQRTIDSYNTKNHTEPKVPHISSTTSDVCTTIPKSQHNRSTTSKRDQSDTEASRTNYDKPSTAQLQDKQNDYIGACVTSNTTPEIVNNKSHSALAVEAVPLTNNHMSEECDNKDVKINAPSFTIESEDYSTHL